MKYEKFCRFMAWKYHKDNIDYMTNWLIGVVDFYIENYSDDPVAVKNLLWRIRNYKPEIINPS